MSTPIKPLGGKAYGSIGHLPQSRLGAGDWHVPLGQANICLVKPRKDDRIIVTEKLDGTCMSVAKIDGEIVPLTRAGYHSRDGLYLHLRLFGEWVYQREKLFSEILNDGERVVGEWMAYACGTLYDKNSPGFSPFIAFDIIRDGKRVLYAEFSDRCKKHITTARELYNGLESYSVERAVSDLGDHGFHGAIEKPEGAVWRVEREGRVDFLAKFVHHDKVDGKYFPNISGQREVWNWKPYEDM